MVPQLSGAISAAALSALSIVLGASSNNIITITCPKLQLESAPQDGDLPWPPQGL